MVFYFENNTKKKKLEKTAAYFIWNSGISDCGLLWNWMHYLFKQQADRVQHTASPCKDQCYTERN